MPPLIRVTSDLVHETVHTATIGGKDLDALIVAEVVKQIGAGAMDPTAIKWKVVYRSETTATEGTNQIAEVTIAVDHSVNSTRPTLTISAKPGDVVSLPPGHHWLDITSMDGGVAYVPVADAPTQ